MSALLTGRTVKGIIEGNADPKRFVPEMLAWHRAGKSPFERLIRIYPFDQINQAIEDLEQGRVVKPRAHVLNPAAVIV